MNLSRDTTRFASRPLIPIIWGLGVFWLVACTRLDTAGTSTGTENPEIAVVIEGTDPDESGTVKLYRTGQNTLLQPDALWSRELAGDTQVILNLKELTEVFDEDSSLAFNLLYLSENRGAFKQGFLFDPGKGTVSLNGEPLISARLNPTNLKGMSVEIVHPQATEDAQEIPLYLLIPGSPFKAPLWDKRFFLQGVPETDMPGQVLTRNGRLYDVSGRIYAQTDFQGAMTGALTDSLALEKIENLVSIEERQVVRDTNIIKIYLSDICDIIKFPNALIYVTDSVQTLVAEGDTLITEKTAIDTWWHFNTDDYLSYQKVLFYSYLVEGEWVPAAPRHENYSKDGYCHSDKPYNSDVRIDSAYFLDSDNWNTEVKIRFTDQALESISFLVEDDMGNFVEMGRQISRYIPPAPEEGLHIFTWEENGSVVVDSIWVGEFIPPPHPKSH